MSATFSPELRDKKSRRSLWLDNQDFELEVSIFPDNFTLAYSRNIVDQDIVCLDNRRNCSHRKHQGSELWINCSWITV